MRGGAIKRLFLFKEKIVSPPIPKRFCVPHTLSDNISRDRMLRYITLLNICREETSWLIHLMDWLLALRGCLPLQKCGLGHFNKLPWTICSAPTAFAMFAYHYLIIWTLYNGWASYISCDHSKFSAGDSSGLQIRKPSYPSFFQWSDPECYIREQFGLNFRLISCSFKLWL